MKTLLQFTFLISLVLSVTNCGKTDYESIYLEDIPANKYYSKDNMPDSYKNVYGTWKFIASSGGFHGGGYGKDFDYLVLKRNCIFGVIRNDSLLAYGKLVLMADNEGLLCTFEADKSSKIELLNDSEKYLELNRDTLNLHAPCCDRYNINLIREN
jgi:hypothetical protein